MALQSSCLNYLMAFYCQFWCLCGCSVHIAKMSVIEFCLFYHEAFITSSDIYLNEVFEGRLIRVIDTELVFVLFIHS